MAGVLNLASVSTAGSWTIGSGTVVTNSGTLSGGTLAGAVTGAQVTKLVIYIDTGTASTSPLVAFLDTSVTGLPVTPNGGDITITWNASGIFTL